MIPLQCELTWPVRVGMGSDSNAKVIEVRDDSSTRRFLANTDAQQLFEYLKAGHELHVVYSTTDGVERRETLGQNGFAQSAAMFEACIGDG